MPRTVKTKPETTEETVRQPAPEARKWGILVPIEQFVAQISARPDKSSLLIYVYRQWPIIDRKLVDSKAVNNIDKIPCEDLPDDLSDYLLKKHGSGKYQMRLFDRNAGKKGAEVLRCEINLNNHDFPPLTDPAEVVERDENRSHIEYLKRTGRWSKGDNVAESNGDAAAVKILAEQITRMANKPTKETDDLDQLTKLAALLKSLAPAGSQSDLSQLLPLMLKVLQPPSNDALLLKLMDQNTALLTKLMEGGNSKGGDAFDEIERVTQLAKALGLKPGGGGSWVSDLVQALPIVASAGATMIAQARAPQQPMTPGVSDAGFPSVLPPPGGVAPGVIETSPAMGGGTDVNMLQMVQIGQKALAAFDRGKTGDSFAEGLCEYEENGDALYEQFAALGVDGLLTAFKQSPFWAKYAARETEVKAWLTEFVAYGSGPAEDEQ